MTSIPQLRKDLSDASRRIAQLEADLAAEKSKPPRVVEKPVEKVVTRTVEKPVEVIKRVPVTVEKPVDRIVKVPTEDPKQSRRIAQLEKKLAAAKAQSNRARVLEKKLSGTPEEKIEALEAMLDRLRSKCK